MIVQLHPDGCVYVRAEDERVVYEEARAVAEADLGRALVLPDGAAALWYDADAETVLHFDRHGNAHPVEGRARHEFGDAVLANLDALRAAKAVRETPPPPPPSAPNAAIDAQIRALELQQLLPRVTREVHLAVVVKDYMRERGVTAATAIAQLTDPAHAGYNLGFTKLKAFDDRIKALREQRV